MTKADKLDLVVVVDPVKYYNMPYKDKPAVARLIGNITTPKVLNPVLI